jgi:hypothetical protein
MCKTKLDELEFLASEPVKTIRLTGYYKMEWKTDVTLSPLNTIIKCENSFPRSSLLSFY